MPHSSPAGPDQPIDSIEDAHRHIRAILARIDEEDDATAMAGLLDDLQVLVEPHFAHEEAPGGFYDQIRDAQPGLDRNVRQLEREHIEMLARLDELRAGFRRLSAVSEQLCGRAADLARQLAEHEKTEASLTMDAYLVDIGISG